MALVLSDGNPFVPTSSRAFAYGNPESIFSFLQGAVYCWCVANGDRQFALRNLVGGVNADWNGTPLQAIYDHYLDHYRSERANTPEETAFTEAAQYAGSMLNVMLQNDVRVFTFWQEQRPYHYAWANQNS